MQIRAWRGGNHRAILPPTLAVALSTTAASKRQSDLNHWYPNAVLLCNMALLGLATKLVVLGHPEPHSVGTETGW